MGKHKSAALSMAKELILLVENDPLVAVVTRLELETLGYQVVGAKEGTEAISIADQERPDVILMDFQLDGPLNGAETASRILAQQKVPIIFLTGRSDSETVQKCLAVKADGYLRKPCSPEQLQEAIESALLNQTLLQTSQQPQTDALHDTLTGLPTKFLLLENIQRKLDAHETDFAILYLDINRFRWINDTYGHHAGDDFLKQFAAKLEGTREHGNCAARIGSDEFAVLLTKTYDGTEAVYQAERIHHLLTGPIPICGESIFVTVSIGVAHANEEYSNGETLLADAETALHEARQNGAATTVLFDRRMLSHTRDAFQLGNELSRAMGSRQLAVYYQPIVDIESGRVSGFEALVRWIHPRLGLLQAADFLGIAEQTGLILPIGRWVLREACVQLAEWQRAHPDLSMHVNLSARHLMQHDLVSEIKRILKETQIPPQSLKIEITENFVIEYTEQVLQRLVDLQSLQIGLQIDDFGKGYSSLSYLHQFPIEALKIDKSFIESTGRIGDASSYEIVETIVGLAKRLRLQVIAEGVETDVQLKRVLRAGCDRVQGYLFSEAVDAAAAMDLMRNFELDDNPPFAA